MHSALLTTTLEKIAVVKEFIDIYNKSIAEKEAALRRRMKVFSVASCVTNLYAIFENFVETSISDHLDVLPEYIRFNDFPPEFKNEYRMGISHILSKIDQERYRNLNHEHIIGWYDQSLKNEENYRFVTAALTRSEQNYRLGNVETLFSRVLMKELKSWLANHSAVRSLYVEGTSVYEQLESEVKAFVQLRNDASHGSLDNLEGKDNLTRFCVLIESLVIALESYIEKSLLMIRVETGKAAKIGDVTEYIPRYKAFVAEAVNGSKWEVGALIQVVGSYHCYTQRIASIQIKDQAQQTHVAAADKEEIGIGCELPVKVKSEIYVLVP
jgi:uncharacterized protein YbgA (DUF1722 family)